MAGDTLSTAINDYNNSLVISIRTIQYTVPAVEVPGIAISVSVCLSVCLLVCPVAHLTGPHVQTSRMLHVAVITRSSSKDNAMCYVLPVFGDDVVFSHNGTNGAESNTTSCFVEFARWRHRGEVRCLRLPYWFLLSLIWKCCAISATVSMQAKTIPTTYTARCSDAQTERKPPSCSAVGIQEFMMNGMTCIYYNTNANNMQIREFCCE